MHRLSGSISRSHHADPFRFENPDSVGEALKKRVERKKLRRQKRMNEELKVNEGLRCFTARRNVWTGAKVVKRAKVEGATSCPSSATKSANGSTEGKLESASTEVNGIESSAVDTSLDDFDNESDDDVVYDTLIPLAPPLLPPNTPMRKNITSKAYTTIYDKVILQSQTPFCPINLQTVISSCVEGWKRDGEWPPKETGPEPMLSRKKVAGEARRQKAEGVGQIGGGQAGRDSWRRSLQRVFGGKTGTADLV